MTVSTMQKAALIALCAMAPIGAAQAAFEFIPAQRPATAPAAGLPGIPPAPQAVQDQTSLSPAPVESVVSEALSNATARTSPQSILPAAPRAPQYSLVPSEPVKTTGGGLIDMNPLGRTKAPEAPMGAASLEAAMMAGGGPVAAPMPAMVSPQAPVIPSRASLSGAAMAPAAGGSTLPEAIGFGRDLPLALAVSQIVPPDYAFSFSTSVNPGETVSWEGGRAWDVVLNDALGAVGARASIDDAKKEVTIVAGASTPSSVNSGLMEPAAYTPPPAPMMAPPPMMAPVAAPVPRAPSAMPAAYQPSGAIAQHQPRVSSATPTALSPAPMDVAAPVAMPPLQAAPASEVPLAAALPAAMTGQAAAPAAQPRMQLAGLNGTAKTLDPKAVRQWEAARGSTLRAILSDWSLQAGVELFWSSDYDYPVESALRLNGTFEEAVQMLLNGLRDARPRPIGRLHPNLPDGPSVLVIETKHIIE